MRLNDDERRISSRKEMSLEQIGDKSEMWLWLAFFVWMPSNVRDNAVCLLL